MSVDPMNVISYRRQRQLKRVGLYGLISIVLLVILLPIVWVFLSSIRPTGDVMTRSQTYIPHEVTLIHYEHLMENTQFFTYYVNSLLVTSGVIVITTVSATLGGYGLARLDIRFKKTFARGVLFGYMFPAILLAIPMFIAWRELGILNSHLGLVLAISALSLPFSLWLMWKFFQTVPYSQEESAIMCGATRFEALVQVVLPQTKPGVVAVAVYSFAVGWNAFTIPKILINDRPLFVLTTGLETFIESQLVLWGPLMAGIFLTMLPPLLFVYFLQKYLLTGFRAGGI